jgi:hypothetical protein
MSNVITPKFRVSYPNVFTPKLNDLNGKNEYSTVCLFKKGEDLSALKKAAEACLVEKLGADKAKWPKNLKSPFRDQGEKEKDGALPDGYEAGAIFMTVKSSQKPGLVDASNQDIIDPVAFYAGCYARASLRPYYYDQKGNKGVAFGLQNIQKLADGESLGGGRVKASDEFEPVQQAEGGDAGGLFD